MLQHSEQLKEVHSTTWGLPQRRLFHPLFSVYKKAVYVKMSGQSGEIETAYMA